MSAKKAAIVTVLLIALAGCSGSIPVIGDDSTDVVEFVPDDAEVVAHVDMGVLYDEETQALLGGFEGSDGSEEVDELTTEFEAETGLDSAGVSDLTVFAFDADAEDPLAGEETGVIAYTDWTEADLIDALEDEEGVEYDATERDRITVYEPQVDEELLFATPVPVAVLDSGTFLFGDEAAMDHSIAVATGEAVGLDGDMREVFDSLSGGYITMVADLGGADLPEEELAGEGIDVSALSDLSVVGVSYGTGSGTAAVDLLLYADSSDSAEHVATAVDGALSMASGTAPDDVRDQLDTVAIEQDGPTVHISYVGDVNALIELMESPMAGAPVDGGAFQVAGAPLGPATP